MALLVDFLSLAASVAMLAAAICAFRLLRDGPPSWWPLGTGSSAQKRRRYHPIAGTFLSHIFNFSRLYDYNTEISRRYKTFRMLGPYHDEIFTTDPAVVEYVLRTNASNYGKGEYNHEVLYELFGDGIFGVDGEKWRSQRKFVSPEFSSRVLKTSSTAIFKANAAKLARAISAAADNHEIIEIQDLFMRSTMDSLFENMAGVQLDRVLGTGKEEAAFAKAFDDLSVQITARYFNPLWRIMRFFNVGPEAAIKENVKVIDNFIYKLIKSKIDNLHSNQGHIIGNPQGKKEDLMSRLLMDMTNDPEGINHKYLKDILLNFLSAGKDTTGGTLSWFFYMLCKHPAVQEKVVSEIREVTAGSGGNLGFEDFANSITEEALNKMQYLHAALTETLRLYPPVPQDSKTCFSDDVLPDGFCVRKGDSMDYQPYPMGRMERLWGEDAMVFRPERWLDEEGHFHPESPFKFTAFQAGPRICMGKEFAYRQMKIYSAVLLNFFEFKLSDVNQEAKYIISITLVIENGLHLHAYRR